MPSKHTKYSNNVDLTTGSISEPIFNTTSAHEMPFHASYIRIPPNEVEKSCVKQRPTRSSAAAVIADRTAYNV